MSGAKLGLLMTATAWKRRSPEGGEWRKGGEGMSPVSLYLFIICSIFMVFSPEEPWGLLCATRLTSKYPWCASIRAAPPPAPSAAQRQAWRVQVLPLNVNCLPWARLPKATVSFPECFPTGLPWARPTCSRTKYPGGQTTCSFHELLQSSSTWRGWLSIFLCHYSCEANVLKSAVIHFLFKLQRKKSN